MKPLICWAIVSKDGRIDISSASYTRRDAISKWSDMVLPWKHWRDKRGFRAAKVTISLADEARARDAQMRAEGRVAGLREAASVPHDPKYGDDWLGMSCAILALADKIEGDTAKARDEAIRGAMSAREGDDGKGKP